MKLSQQESTALRSAVYVQSIIYIEGKMDAQRFKENLVSLLDDCSAEQLDVLAAHIVASDELIARVRG